MRKLLLFLFLMYASSCFPQAPKVLIVTAHPDDDALFAGTVYKITHHLKGTVDLCLFTNGEGGFKYSTLAEDIYGLELTDENIGRENLPAIRKRELMEGGRIVGISQYFFLEQKDHKYTLDINEVLDSIWNVPQTKLALSKILMTGNYDFVFVMIPSESTHAHHAASAIITLTVIDEMDDTHRPIVLGGFSSSKSDTAAFSFYQREGFPVSKIDSLAPVSTFDRTQKFGFNNVLDYKIIVNWLIAEHKSQGTMQLLMNRGDYENYLYFNINEPDGIEKTRQLFERLKEPQFETKIYE